MRTPTVSEPTPLQHVYRRPLTASVVGHPVAVTIYGERQTGTISRSAENEVVFVRMDKTGRERWFHAESVSPIKPEPNT